MILPIVCVSPRLVILLDRRGGTVKQLSNSVPLAVLSQWESPFTFLLHWARNDHYAKTCHDEPPQLSLPANTQLQGEITSWHKAVCGLKVPLREIQYDEV
jgi:hypothetical protein